MRWLMDNVEVFKASYRFVQSGKYLGFSQIFKTDIREYNMFVNDDAVSALFGVSARTPNCGVGLINGMFNTEQVPAYFCNEAFMAMPDWAKKCAMLHEEAHIFNKDYAIKRNHLLYMVKRMFKEPEEELNADRYAFSVVGDEYVEFLKYFAQFGVGNVNQRIQNLKGE
jgi:hypothetical protein